MYIYIYIFIEFYGGQLDFGGKDSCRFKSPEVVDLAHYVERVNEGQAQPVSQFEPPIPAPKNCPPGEPGNEP
jgi:hypothetical protein